MEFDETRHDHCDERTFDFHKWSCDSVEKNLENDEESVDFGKKNHPCDEMVGLETTESDGLKGSKDNGTVPSLLVNGSGSA